ncbi:hypothetical protein J4402_03115 [Candidatus Pacearchaeota archaeon]|nr:hypothetical protein [Candidatus Pacearchaeota archaeon]
MNKESITKEAKKILDNFAKSLEKVKISPVKTKQETSGFREESQNPNPVNEEFKKRIFSNAIETEGDFLVAEKKKW